MPFWRVAGTTTDNRRETSLVLFCRVRRTAERCRAGHQQGAEPLSAARHAEANAPVLQRWGAMQPAPANSRQRSVPVCLFACLWLRHGGPEDGRFGRLAPQQRTTHTPRGRQVTWIGIAREKTLVSSLVRSTIGATRTPCAALGIWLVDLDDGDLHSRDLAGRFPKHTTTAVELPGMLVASGEATSNSCKHYR
jgi:hypothetical protein